MKGYVGLRSKKHQLITNEDIEAVVKALNSDSLTQGPTVEQFEDRLTEVCKTRFAVAVNSATSALHLACMSVGLGPGDRLWTVPNSFVASANCGLYCGATVDFVDISEDGYNMCENALADKLERAAKRNQLPKVIIPIHFAGQPAKMKRIYELAKKYGAYVFEDASHALGATYLGAPVGNCHYSDATIFSFHPVKIITSGEGGAVVTNNPQIAENVALLRSHGVTRDVNKLFSGSDGPWYYQQIALGYKYRITDIQAALGASQLKRLDSFIVKRTHIADFYDKNLAGMPLRTPKRDSESTSSWHLYVIRLNLNEIKRSRKEVFMELWERHVPVNVHYIPIHTQPYYKEKGFKTGDFPNSEKHYAEAISLPMHCNLEDEELKQVVSALHETLK